MNQHSPGLIILRKMGESMISLNSVIVQGRSLVVAIKRISRAPIVAESLPQL